MSIGLYDASIATYLQTLGGVANVLAKGRDYAEAGNMDLAEIVRYRLREDMAPFSFQAISVWHHSLGNVRAMKSGIFEPPPKMSGMDYDKLEALIAEATEVLQTETREEIDALLDKPMVFRIGGRDIPFTTTSFLFTFSLPNFFFHAATLYDILRMHGVPLGKMDFIGQMRIGH
jgi:hypothetical protein